MGTPRSTTWRCCCRKNLIYFAIDDAIFLNTPTPVREGMSADPAPVGHEMISMAAKDLVLPVVGGIAAGAYYAVRVSTENPALAWITTWLVFLPFAAGSTFFAGVAFRNPDLDRDPL